MKHRIALLISFGVIAAAGIGAINAHRGYVHQQALQTARTAAAQAKANAQRLATDEQQISQLETACQNGLDAYNLLTPVQQRHVEKPVCMLE